MLFLKDTKMGQLNYVIRVFSITICLWVGISFPLHASSNVKGSTSKDRVLAAIGNRPVSPGDTVQDDKDLSGPMLLISSGDASQWMMPMMDVYPIFSSIESMSCTGMGFSAVCVVIGYEDRLKLQPLIGVSQDGGRSWEVKWRSQRGYVSDVSCAGNGSSAICIVPLNKSATTVFDKEQSEVLVSQDGGATWDSKYITDLPNSGFLGKTSCAGDNLDSVCAIVGVDVIPRAAKHEEYLPFVVVGDNQGQDWFKKQVPDLLVNDLLNVVSCTGKGSFARCLAIGNRNIIDPLSNKKTHLPLIFLGTNRGEHWERLPLATLHENTQLMDVSCTGDADEAICAAIGFTLESSYIVVSTDGGHTWDIKYDEPGFFNSVSCSGEGSSALCVAVGSSKGAHVVVVSSDGGHHWASKYLPRFPNDSDIRSVSCQGDICFLVGNVFLAVSSDRGNTWNRPQSVLDLHLSDGELIKATSSGT